MGMARGLADGLLRFCNGAWRDNDGDAVDIAEVVRCKNCKYYGSVQEPCHGRTQRFCGLHKGLVIVDRDTFCSYG